VGEKREGVLRSVKAGERATGTRKSPPNLPKHNSSFVLRFDLALDHRPGKGDGPNASTGGMLPNLARHWQEDVDGLQSKGRGGSRDWLKGNE